MPRHARLDSTGALHHVIIRGIARTEIFLDNDDREDFVERMSRLVPETKITCYAWVLMSNHAHILLRTGDVPLSTFMARLLTGYASGFNRRHERSGHLFQNRYRSIICQEEPYLRELLRYIHLNPLRAGVVPDYEKLPLFHWSGHAAILGDRNIPWQDTGYVLELFGASDRQARTAYSEFVRSGVDRGRRPELTGGGLIRSLGESKETGKLSREDPAKGDERILGDTSFVTNLLARAAESKDPSL